MKYRIHFVKDKGEAASWENIVEDNAHELCE